MLTATKATAKIITSANATRAIFDFDVIRIGYFWLYRRLRPIRCARLSPKVFMRNPGATVLCFHSPC